jgi:hypothetical protein
MFNPEVFFLCEGCKRTREKGYLQWISTEETVKINKTSSSFFFESIKIYLKIILKIYLFYIFISVSQTFFRFVSIFYV